MKDFYETLGIAPEAGKGEIKKAYFKLVRQYPPDRFEEEFMAIREAYEVLSDEKTRQEFDLIYKMPPVFREKFELSLTYIEENELEKAISILEDLVKKIPGMSVLNLLLGEVYSKNSNTGKAIKIFEKLVKETPGNAGFLGHLANSYLERGWHKKAADTFKKAIKIDRDNLSLYLGLSDAYLESENINASRDVLNNALSRFKEINEDNTSLYYQLIMTDIMARDLEAIENHSEGLAALALNSDELKDNIAWTISQLADQLVQISMIEDAEILIKKALLISPDDESILKIQKEITLRGAVFKSFDNLSEDKSIHEDIIDILELELMDANIDSFEMMQKNILKFHIEIEILEDIQLYRKSIKILKEKYPELYELRKDFFNLTDDTIKRNQALKKLRKENHEIEAFKEMFAGKSLFGMDEDGSLDEDEYWDEDDIFFEEPHKREEPKISRNAPCPCGSGKKYKKCCGK